MNTKLRRLLTAILFAVLSVGAVTMAYGVPAANAAATPQVISNYKFQTGFIGSSHFQTTDGSVVVGMTYQDTNPKMSAIYYRIDGYVCSRTGCGFVAVTTWRIVALGIMPPDRETGLTPGKIYAIEFWRSSKAAPAAGVAYGIATVD